MTIPRRKYVTFAYCSVTILLLLPSLDLTTGLLQTPASNVFVGRPTSDQLQSTFLCSFSVVDDVDEKISSDNLAKEDETQAANIWDEQFQELQIFKSEYGHCNFPQNPSKVLEEKYPRLQTFCFDQRMEYRQLQNSVREGELMSLQMFDLHVRSSQLRELGFEFNKKAAGWFDSYHELLQYNSDNGHTRVSYAQDFALVQWMKEQRYRYRLASHPDSQVKLSAVGRAALSDLQIKLLDAIRFEWEPESAEELWDRKYKELVAFRKKNGNLLVEYNGVLDTWMREQRRKRRRKKGRAALTKEQIRLLDEIEFPWEPERLDQRWHAMYNELKRFQHKYGHSLVRRSANLRLYSWSMRQRKKHQLNRLSTEQIKLLTKLGFPFERRGNEWKRMYKELAEYSKTNGHLRVNRADNPELDDWISVQRERYHTAFQKQMLSDQQIENLEEIHFCWSLDWRDRTWHEKFTEVAEFFKEHGHVLVTKSDNPGLYNWIQAQEKRYKETKGQKPLSNQELEMLEQIDFSFFDGQPRMAWNAMYAELTSYRKENDGQFPTSHRTNPDLYRWMRQQRHRYRSAYGYVALSEKQKELLESIDFPMYPKSFGRVWYEKYDEVVKFWKQHGHFVVDRREQPTLYIWVDHQRQRFRGFSANITPLPKQQLYLLERIGFTWTTNRFEMEWQENYDAVSEFFELQGRCPTLYDNAKLGKWLEKQFQKLRGTSTGPDLSEYQIQQLEIIGIRSDQ